MTNASRVPQTSVEFDVSYRIAAWSMLRMTREEIAPLRKGPPGFFPPNAKSILLKHCDEQTVVGLAAIFQAIGAFDLAGADFGAWGVVAAPRFMGRAVVSETLDRYAIDGAWGISMQLVPHYTLHAQASTISLSLGARGPSIGAGGGVGSEAEGALTTLGFLRRQANEGMWLLWTGWEPEMVVAAGQAAPLTDSRCVALAMAIQGHATADDASRFRVYSVTQHSKNPTAKSAAVHDAAANSRPARVLCLVDQACERQETSLSLAFDLGGGLRQELELSAPAPARAVSSLHSTPHGVRFDGCGNFLSQR